ncbi:MAG TPA: zf-HC2 domain-containing protein [Nitrospiria bacterium]
MNCKDVQKHLSEYIGGELGPEEAKTVRDHLSSCERCRGEAETLALTIKTLGSLPEADPPRGFSGRVMTKVREIETDKKSGFWSRFFLPRPIQIPAQLTALLVVGLIGVVIYQSITPVPLKRDMAGSLESESGEGKGIIGLAELKKEERTDAPASPKPEALGKGKREMDEVGGLAVPEAERPRVESEEQTAVLESALEAPAPEEAIAFKEKVEPPAVITLALSPYRPDPDPDRLKVHIAGLAREVGGEAPPADKKGSESRPSRNLQIEPAAVFISIPENRIDQFKALLADLGRIEDGEAVLQDKATETRQQSADEAPISGFSSSDRTPPGRMAPASPPEAERSKMDPVPTPIFITITLTPPKTP